VIRKNDPPGLRPAPRAKPTSSPPPRLASLGDPTKLRPASPPRLASLAAALLAISGCVPPDSALRRPVDAELARRLGDTELRIASADADPAAAAAIADRLGKPLDRAAAIRIALANNPRLRAALAEVGVAAADLALRLGPAEIHVEARFSDGTDLELDVLQDLLGLITAAPRRAAARAATAAAQAAATAAALRLVARVEIAFHDLIAAQQELELRRTAFDAADAAALIRERMHAAGNTPVLALARDRDAREQARVELARAEAALEVRREALNALLGLTGAQTRWTAAGRLADLPAAPPALDDLEPRAVAASVELAGARARAGAAANRVTDARLRTALPHLAAGVSIHREHAHGGTGDADTSIGPAVRIGLPVFDWNSGGRARAHAERRVAEHELAAIAVELRSSARAARITALAAYQEARHLRDVVLPLRQQIVDETLKHYNAMDADPFGLILARRELADAGHQYLDALRRYWNAISTVSALERGVAVDAPGGDPADSPRTPPRGGGDAH
jgi:outer membrane protein TolC